MHFKIAGVCAPDFPFTRAICCSETGWAGCALLQGHNLQSAKRYGVTLHENTPRPCGTGKTDISRYCSLHMARLPIKYTKHGIEETTPDCLSSRGGCRYWRGLRNVYLYFGNCNQINTHSREWRAMLFLRKFLTKILIKSPTARHGFDRSTIKHVHLDSSVRL